MNLGATINSQNSGCVFKVWAPFAQNVDVIGDFNQWTVDNTGGYGTKNRDAEGVWTLEVPAARPGQKYKYRITGPEWNAGIVDRPDPWSRQMEHSAGASIITDPDHFQWTDQHWQTPPFEDMVIYELHLSTFIGKNDGQTYPGDFNALKTKLDYIKGLGANTIELLPLHEYAGEDYLGYAPVAFFPIESGYGTQQGSAYEEFKSLVDAAHARGLAVIADVEFNHFTDRQGDDKWIWNFDGDTRYGKGGIYFNGHNTDWGPAPDWENQKVVDYVKACCHYYLNELHVDGLRWDATQHIKDKPGGWQAMRDILWDLQTAPGNERKIFIAENLPYERAIVDTGNFDSGWWVQYHHSLEKALGGRQDKGGSVAEGINGGDYSALYKRVVYTLGHDEARNGSQYLISEFGGRHDWTARAKRRLISALQFFIPGIPMIWQGEEFLQDGHFHDHYDHAVNWAYQTDPEGAQMQALYQDAIAVRNHHTALRYGQLHWAHAQDPNGVVAFLRKDPVNGQTVMIIINLGGTDWGHHSYGVHTGGEYGQWQQVFCSQEAAYGGWEWSGNAFYEPWTQADGKVYVNVPKYSVIALQKK